MERGEILPFTISMGRKRGQRPVKAGQPKMPAEEVSLDDGKGRKENIISRDSQ